MDAARRRPRRAGGHLRAAPGRRCWSRRCTPTGSRAWSRSGRGSTTTRPPLPFRAEAAAPSTTSCRRTRAGRCATGTSWRDGLAAGSPRSSSTRCCCEPHSTKQLEDVLGWTRRHDGPGDARGPRTRARYPADIGGRRGAAARRSPCPVLVIQGTEDRCQPLGRAPAARRVDRRRAAGARGLRPPADGPRPGRGQPRDQGLRGPGHRCAGRRASREAAARRGRPRALYLTSPIGLGHVRRDLAIADAMRERRPDLEVQWLTQSPVAEFLEQRGEVVHPASRLLANESGHFESESGEHDLHAFQAVRRMDEVLVNNFMVFDDLVEREAFDLWVGDEAWDLDHFLHENPELKRAPFVWMTDFVGLGADARRRRAGGVPDRRLQRRDGRARRALPRAARPVGVRRRPGRRGRPAARARTCRRPASGPRSTSTSPGYVMGERPDPADREALRHRLGYADGEVVCVVSVGGSGVGDHLLRRVVASYDEARRRIPGLRMVVVAGPRIDPALAGRARGRGGARLPARPRPAPRGVRRGRRPGRAEHHDGADGGAAGRSCTSRSATTSSSRCTCGTGWSGTGPAGRWTTATPTRAGSPTRWSRR